MKIKKTLGVVGLAGIVSLSTFGSTVVADTSKEPVKDEKWGNPVYVYGDALTDEQIEEVANTFEKTLDEVTAIPVNGKDMVRLLDTGSEDSNMYSSALIERKDKGHGVKVYINQPENITRIGESQYENAMITAGVTDAYVQVTSPVRVTGESALTGIYKAYESQGDKLDDARMAVAQEELEVTADIGDVLKDKEGFSQEQLDDALIEIKQKIGEAGEGVTKEEIEEIINNALNGRDLGTLIDQEHVERLVDLAKNYSETDAINSEEVKKQLNELSQNVAEKLGDFRNSIEESGILEKIGNFFKDLFHAIAGVFKG